MSNEFAPIFRFAKQCSGNNVSCYSIVTLSTGLVDFIFAIYNRYANSDNNNSQDNDIGYSAHIGGAAAGFLVGMNILRNFHHKVSITFANINIKRSYLVYHLKIS